MDVYVRYLNGHAAEMQNVRGDCEQAFIYKFGLPLHFLFLSDDESLEAASFLGAALKSGSRVL